MAFGIGEAFSAAAAGVELTNTVVEIIKRYRGQGKDLDLELLIEEIRVTALTRIDEAEMALFKFERMLVDQKVDIEKRITDVIAATPFWSPWEQHRMKQIHKNLNAFSDSLFSAVDDIAALLRCQGQTDRMGAAVVDSSKQKDALRAKMNSAPSLKRQIEILRAELTRHKEALK